jgi:hypothetical protein
MPLIDSESENPELQRHALQSVFKINHGAKLGVCKIMTPSLAD